MSEPTKDCVEELNLYQKLAKIRGISDVAKRSKEGYGYTYTDITEILLNVKAGMKKYGVSLVPIITPGTGHIEQNVVENIKYDKTGNQQQTRSTEMLFYADMVYRWVNDDNPEEYIDIPWFVTGAQSDPSQGFATGMSYTLRIFLTAYFQIAQTQIDVDAYRSKQKQADAAEDRMVAEEIVTAFDEKLKIYLADHQDKADEVKKFITRYAKNANYFAIKEPALASKLMEDFKNTYLKEDS